MKSIDEQVKDIMQLKDKYGEFSLDLYYNDCTDEEHAFTAKIHSALYETIEFHARCASFNEALDEVRNYIENQLRRDLVYDFIKNYCNDTTRTIK